MPLLMTSIGWLLSICLLLMGIGRYAWDLGPVAYAAPMAPVVPCSAAAPVAAPRVRPAMGLYRSTGAAPRPA